MSRTIHGSKGPGYDYWTPRPLACLGPLKRKNWWLKRATHKRERLQAKAIIRHDLLHG